MYLTYNWEVSLIYFYFKNIYLFAVIVAGNIHFYVSLYHLLTHKFCLIKGYASDS